MSSKMKTSLLLVLTMLISTIGTITAYGTSPCLTISECVDLASEARDNIAEIIEQEDQLNDKIAELNAEISTLRGEIENLELSIGATTLEIAGLQTEITNNTELSEQIDKDIEELLEVVADRMLLAQRMENTNIIFTILGESGDLTDFISQLRFFNRIATTDADVMDQLTDLLDEYDGIIETLSNQLTILGETQEALEKEQEKLESTQVELIMREGALREELHQFNLDRLSEEEVLAAAEEAREVLERTPPPPVTTSTGTTATPGELVRSGGMTHPLPGGILTSPFGPRSFDGFHWGTDWSLGGQPSILAAASGTVVRNERHDMFGWWVIIAHDINGERVDTVYAHMLNQSPHPAGTVVEQGQVIGTQGNTGNSFGAHLHFEVHPGGFAWNNSVDAQLWIN